MDPTLAQLTGSSPLAWGTLHPVRDIVEPQRFIPTRVGNTTRFSMSRNVITVHPHSRGEHGSSKKSSRSTSGSSPLAWGTHYEVLLRHLDERFIPTRVGNTCAYRGRNTRRAVHPHSRGEHFVAPGTVSAFSGSSPLAWGTPVSISRVALLIRFIPTRVGNTAPPVGPARSQPVHPHSRGEHCAKSLNPSCNCGSSPLAWGTPIQSQQWP